MNSIEHQMRAANQMIGEESEEQSKDSYYLLATIACYRDVPIQSLPTPNEMYTYQVDKLTSFMKTYTKRYRLFQTLQETLQNEKTKK